MKMTSTLTALSVALLTLASASSAQAAAARTFVSGTGSDSNAASDCPRPTPCRNFQAAHDVTLSGGQIIALDPNGFGQLVINRAITVVGAETAQVVVPVGSTGITVNAGAGNDVTLRNIQVFGAGRANTTGIDLNSGELILESSSLEGLTLGLDIASGAKADVIDSKIYSNTTGVQTNGQGLDTNFATTEPGTTHVRMFGGAVVNNGTGFNMLNPQTASGGATQNRTTVIYGSFGNMPTTYQAGNDTVITGSGTGCDQEGECRQGYVSGTANGFNIN